MTSVVTDNARNMDKIRGGLKKDDSSLHDFVELALPVIVSSCFCSIHREDFSSFGGIHAKIPNHLGNEKTAKLVFVRGSSENFVIWIIDD